MLTVVTCTARKNPGFKWLADSLVKSASFSGTDFEWIVVDKLLWPELGNLPSIDDTPIDEFHVAMEKHADEENARTAHRMLQVFFAVDGRFPFRHVTPKPSPWQGPWRKTQRDYYDLNGARNTGITLARGRQVALLDDCSLINDEWLYWHARGMERGIVVCGSFRSYTQATVENGQIVEPFKFHPLGTADSRGEVFAKAGGGWFWGLNCSFPVEAALVVNGFDEQFSGQGGSEDCHMGLRLEKAGYQLVYMPSCITHQILSNHEPVCETNTWGEPQKTPQKERVLEADGKGHFANEWLIQEYFKSPYIQAKGNPFSIRELRTKALTEGNKAFPRDFAIETDWRDGQLLKEMK